MILRFVNQFIYDSQDNEVAGLSVRSHLPDKEKYVVYLESVFDYMNAQQIQEYISATDELKPTTIVQAAMVASFKEQLKNKLHTCLMETNLQYRYEFETSQMRKQIQQLEQWLEEERKRRWKAESEVHELKMALKESEEDTECQD